MKRILVLEDDFNISYHIKEIALEIQPNLEVITSESGLETIEICRKMQIDALFIDIQLVDITGLETAKMIRNFANYAFVPIVFITAIPSKELEAFREIHCYDYIVKPFTEVILRQTLKKILIDYAEEKKIRPRSVTIEMKGIRQIIYERDIVFIEYANRRINIYLKKDKIVYKHMPLTKFLEDLSSDFTQVHQSFLVNRHYIKKVDTVHNYIEMSKRDEQIPIGKNYQKKAGEF